MFFSGSGPAAKTLSLTFSPSNKKAAKEVKVYATEDENNTDETATITISADGVTSETVAVSLLDAGAKLIIVPSGPIDVTEGAEPQTFKIKLNSEPAAGRKIRFKKSNEKSKYRIKIDGKTDKKVVLTLSKAELKDGKDISVSAVLDNDTEGGTVEITPQLQKIANGKVAWKQATESEISVNVQDDSNIKLSVSKASLKLAEGGSGTFTVKLASQPSADVTVTLAQPGTANADVTLDDTDTNMAGRQNTLTFTTANWSAAQTVKVRAAQDADNSDDTATIKLTGAGVTPYLMKVSVADDDEDAAGLILSADSLTVEEGGNGSFTVKLATQPTGDVTVSITQPDNPNADVTTNPTSLTFTTGNWGDTQTVTVFGGKDSDATDDKATLRVSASGGGYGSVADKEVKVTVKDAAGLKVSKTSLTFSENSSGTFTVRLATAPIGTVTVSITQPNNSNADVTVDTDSSTTGNQNTLTFTTGDWGTVQTVTVNGAEDDDGIDDSATLRVSATGGGYGSVDHKEVEVTVRDSDTPALTVSATSLTVTEAATGTFTVALATKPSASVTVNITQTGTTNTDVTTTPASLTFTTGNWNATQTVTVNAAEDDDGGNDSATLRVKATGGGYGPVAHQDVSITVTDNDTPALKVSTASLAVPEGSNATFTVKLATRPSADVTVTLAQPIGSVNTDVTLDTDPNTANDQNRLTFTTANWSTAQTVTVKAAQDPDAIEDKATINVSATGGDYATVTTSVEVTVTEDDTAGFTFDPASPTVNEGSTDTFTVALTSQPSTSVTVTLAQPTDNTDVTLDTDTSTAENQNRLTFTTANWSTAQTVTVKAAQDPDAIQDTATINVSATGGDYASVTASVEVTVTEDDAVGYTIDPASPTVNEGSTATFTVALTSQPSHSVTVTLAQPTDNTDVTLDTDTSTAENQNRLTFTTANWNTAQTVTVKAAQDDDAIQDTATIAVSAAGGDYASVTASVEVTVTEDDTAGYAFNPTAPSVREGSTDTFTVALTSQPSHSVTVTLAQPTDNTDVTLDTDTSTAENQNRLTFTTANWSTGQTVTVRAAQDDDAIQDTATIDVSATGGDYATVTTSVEIKVTEDDTAGYTFASTPVTVTEGSTATFTVALTSQPSASVTMTLRQPTNTDVTVDTDTSTAENQNQLTFTTTNWGTAQTVTVSAAEDDNGIQDTATIGVSAAGGDYGSVTGSVGVTVTENDTQGLTVSATSLTMTENSSGTFTVVLATKPSASVTVTLAQPAGSVNPDVTLDTDPINAGNQNTLIFTTGNWDTAQWVAVNTAKDDDGIQDTATIRVSAAGGGYGSVGHKDVSVTVTDNDTAGLMVSKTTLTVDENSSDSFTVQLATQPSASVTVSITRPENPNADVTTTPASLTFTTGNWNTTQTVTVSAADDADIADDSATINLRAAGGDYAGKTGRVTVTVHDDDAKLVLSTSSLEIDEEQSGTFTVKLKTRPSASVTVRLAQPENTDVTVDTNTGADGNQNTLTFTTDNWDNAQTVTVKTAHDADIAQDTATISLTASGGGYGGKTKSVSVSVTDDDNAALILSTSSVTVAEGGSGRFTVRLATKPASNVTVTLNPPSNTDVTIVDTDPSTAGTQNTLTFTPSNWNADQTVTVNAAEDDDAITDSATINLTASGADYGEVTGEVTVNVTETDTAGLVVEGSPVTVPEGGSNTFTIKLSSKPSGNVTVSLSQKNDDDSPDVSFDANVSTARTETSLEFTPGNWNTARTVKVNAAEDNDAIEDRLTIRLKASDADYTGKTADVPVTVTENDAPGLMLSKTVLTMDEGESDTFTVRLATQPSGSVTVRLARSGDTDVTRTPTSLTFTASNWSQTQTVTVSAEEDADARMDEATINLTASGADYGSVTGSVAVKVADDDAVALTLSDTSWTMTEGTSRTFTVRLAVNPGGARTVSLASTNTDVTVSPVVLNFTSNDATTAKTVTVSAAQDNDKVDDTAMINLTGTGIRTKSVSVKVLDDDLELVLSTDELCVTEGTSENFTVRLASRPVNSRTVNLTFSESNPDVTADTKPRKSGNQTTLTFTSDNWSTAQAVTVSAAEDDDEQDESAKLRLSGAGLQTGEVEIEVIDDDGNDAELRFVLTPSLVTLTEQGRSETFKVRLNLPPGTDRSVNLIANDNSDVRFVGATSLTFTDFNWRKDRTVTIKAIGDIDSADEEETVKVKSAGIPTGQVTVEITDDDNNSLEIIISGETKQKVPMTINEGSSGTFDVYLSAPPVNGSTVEVRVECFNNNDIWLSHARLNFTNSNWDIPITVRFSAANDTDENDDMADIDLRSSGLTTKWVKATIIDDDYDPLSPPDETPTNCRMPNGQTCPIRDPGVEIR